MFRSCCACGSKKNSTSLSDEQIDKCASLDEANDNDATPSTPTPQCRSDKAVASDECTNGFDDDQHIACVSVATPTTSTAMTITNQPAQPVFSILLQSPSPPKTPSPPDSPSPPKTPSPPPPPTVVAATLKSSVDEETKDMLLLQHQQQQQHHQQQQRHQQMDETAEDAHSDTDNGSVKGTDDVSSGDHVDTSQRSGSDNSNNSSKTESFSDNSQIQQNVPNVAAVAIATITVASPNGIDDGAVLSSSSSPPPTNISPESSDENSSEQLRSCLSRRTSSIASVKKRVILSDSNEVIPMSSESPPQPPSLPDDLAAADFHLDDDEVFSDSISPKMPRGDMCTPYPKKKSSIPGVMYLPDWFTDDREVVGILDPPNTPIGRDELALKRHRFFADLLSAAQAAAEHRVRFNPLGPDIAIAEDNSDCEQETRASSNAELSHLVNRLERIVDRLERTVSARELESVNVTLNAVIQKTDSEELDSLPLPSPPPQLSLTLPPTATSSSSSPPPDITSSPSKDQSPPPPPPHPVLNAEIESAAHLSVRPPIYNGDSVDLDSLPTVINQLCSDEYLTTAAEEEPDYQPPITMSVLGYQDIVDGPLAQYLQLSAKIGGDVAQHAENVAKAFAAQLQYVTLASTSAKPSDAQQQELLKPTSDQICEIQQFREKNRQSEFNNHLLAISESIPALGWVCVTPTPGPHVKEMADASQFYTNRVLKDWKDKNATHVEWARAWVQTLTELQKYIRQYHTTGLVWSGKTVLTSSGAPPPPPPGGMPPPPPPMLPPIGDMSLADDERGALFAQINQGEDITKSLKKVTSDMQTHKNSALRTGPAPFKAPAPAAVPKAPTTAAAKPPVFVRDGKKWIIEYQKNNPNLVVEDAEMNNVAYLFKCDNSTLTVKGKVNGIIVDSCKKCSILFDNLVSSIEFVNCQSVQMQVLGSVPTISIDKTDGCQMYLSDKSLDVEIISSKSSEMNVLIPKGNGEYVEKPVPEQFKTKVNGESLSTICVESLG